MKEKTRTETKRRHRVEHVTDLYPDGPEKPTVFHYIRKEDRGRDAVTLCGEVIPARNMLYGDKPGAGRRSYVICPFCELLWQTLADGREVPWE